MRILLITDEYPWPPRTGYRQRITGILGVLARMADVDLFVAAPASHRPSPPPADAPQQRLAVIPTPRRTERRAVRLRRWVGGSRPRSLLWRDWTAPRAALPAWAGQHYDAVWFSQAASYLALSDLVPGPHIVDFDNLNSFSLRHRRAALVRDPLRDLRPAALLGAARDAVDERRWITIEREIARRAAAVIVCSDLDRLRLGRPGAHVVPNGYEPDELAVGGEVGRPEPPPHKRFQSPVLLMVGLLTYAPNRDGAAVFARRVLPVVRTQVPDVEFRIVGRYDYPAQIAAFSGLPNVTVTGEVRDLRSELCAATAAVVPIRFGGGTRIKILEAFAWGLPVVSTSVGAEGLGVVDGEHLLLADGRRALARACVRVLTDADLRARLSSGGFDLWSQQYRWSAINDRVRAVLASATGDRRAG